jgi:hypothetical protein
VFAGKEKIDVSRYNDYNLRHAGMNEERRGRDSLTACLLPVPNCSNYPDHNGLRQQVKQQFEAAHPNPANFNATKPPQKLGNVFNAERDGQLGRQAVDEHRWPVALTNASSLT